MTSTHTSVSPPAVSAAYAGRATSGVHRARSAGPTQLDSVEIQAGMGFGGEWERAQLWMILKGQGRMVHGEQGEPLAAATGHMEHFAAQERRLLVAETDVTLLIIEAEQFHFDGPWSERQEPWRRVVGHHVV